VTSAPESDTPPPPDTVMEPQRLNGTIAGYVVVSSGPAGGRMGPGIEHDKIYPTVSALVADTVEEASTLERG
jgi:hypothetical protein